MCGILAIFGEYEKKTVKKAINLLEHRGPDSSGEYFDAGIAFAHKRLSIIDLNKRASQPFISREGNVIIYNGEVYNFKEVREEINAKKKYPFRTESDTEVILAAYETFGETCVKKFNGMFSFVIYNKKKKEIFVVRDRLGIKPLYYFKDKEKLIFASEIKSILEFVKPKLNKRILYDYFNYNIQISDQTLFKNIRVFPRASYRIITRTNTTTKKYWDIEYSSENKSEREFIHEFRELLEESIKKRMISDVPLGSFLSGGLDSSVISAIMAKQAPGLKTFSVAYDTDPTENRRAEEVSQFLGTDHHSLNVSAHDFVKKLPDMIWHYDQPISFASSIPLYFLAKQTKDKVTVVLTGEGADELLAGYSRYSRFQKMLRFNQIIPSFWKDLLFRFTKDTADPRYRKNFEIMTKGFNLDYITGVNNLISSERKKTLKFEETDVLKKRVGEMYREKSTSLLNRNLWIDLNTYLQELLVKQDRMSMAASIESRVPFLDHKLVEFSAKLPTSMKLRNGSGKYILKQTALQILPKQILKKKKMGFTVPLNKWFKGELKEYIKDQICDPALDNFFKRRELERFIELNKSRDVSLQLWAILNFKIWYQQNFKK